MRSPLCLLFSKLNKPNYFSHSSYGKIHLSRILHMPKTNQKMDVLRGKEEKYVVTAILWSSSPTCWSLCFKNSLNPRFYLYKVKYRCCLFFYIVVLLWPGSSSVTYLRSISISTLPKCLSQLCDTLSISWKVHVWLRLPQLSLDFGTWGQSATSGFTP